MQQVLNISVPISISNTDGIEYTRKHEHENDVSNIYELVNDITT